MIAKHWLSLLAMALTVGIGLPADGENGGAPPSDSVFAAMMKAWQAPADPLHVAGPIYFVGTRGLGVWLVTTPEGHILVGGGMPPSTSLIVDSIRKLGFKVEDVKILLSNHAHFDHVGTLAELKKLSGGKVMAMEQDAALLASGGATDYLFAKEDRLHFPAASVDRALKDGDLVELGGVKVTTHHAPGHTRGCAVYTMTVEESGKQYSVVFADGTSVNPGTRLVKAPSYPGILEDYRRTFALLESLKPDIYLAYHVDDFGFPAKRERMAKDGVQAFVDPQGYRSFIEARKAKFEALVEKEK
jgi:metallo-beta-lactamase class B